MRGHSSDGTSFIYAVKADGLSDLEITTEDRPVQFSRTIPARQILLLVRPWSCHLLELHDSANDKQSVANWSTRASRFLRIGQPLGSFFDALRGFPGEIKSADTETHSRALRLIVHFGQPFSAFLLAQQLGGEYKRIASDQHIIAQVKDMAFVCSMMDVRTLEIL
ncbi:uncharacterized protein BJ212DRAFT_1362434 [Suillus subaureus]|uniref:Uncharacterized protein n=1 Tax=Suillus subaureus TaxID=48587 RepID=A0A9P7JCF8_9AGAM|nr:uncharacterized protein BJ212DRAFT_1362434 [Suillus subaureus]KAG1814263.1 hypothetical protein BJ212DRAFT_1362434 [Suillus subaureus]